MIPKNWKYEQPAFNTLKTAALSYMDSGFSLIPLAPKSKSAEVSPSWSSDSFRIIKGREHWDYYPHDNIGANLGRSGLLSLDIDDIPGFDLCMQAVMEKLLESTDVYPQFWKAKTAGIRSGNPGSSKRLFRVPDNCPPLSPQKINWVSADGKSKCIFELRCGSGMQDVLPPSIYPKKNINDEEKRYQWIKHPDAAAVEILDAPYDLIYFWTHFTEFKALMEKANPDYVEPIITKKMRDSGVKYEGTNYIEMWKSQQDLESMLLSNGYVRKGANRFLSPDSSSGNPGIVIYDHGATFFSHGKSDQFGDGHQHDAYDILVECEYHGDRGKAWEHVLDYFGVTSRERARMNAVKAQQKTRHPELYAARRIHDRNENK